MSSFCPVVCDFPLCSLRMMIVKKRLAVGFVIGSQFWVYPHRLHTTMGSLIRNSLSYLKKGSRLASAFLCFFSLFLRIVARTFRSMHSKNELGKARRRIKSREPLWHFTHRLHVWMRFVEQKKPGGSRRSRPQTCAAPPRLIGLLLMLRSAVFRWAFIEE